jgi:hypothetical protein
MVVAPLDPPAHKTAKLHKDMPMEQYQAAKDHISKSMLSDFADCPARFKYLHIDGGEKPSTPSLRLGHAVHTLALEPDLYKKNYYVMPLKEDGKEIIRNASHAAYKEQLEVAAGRMILSRSELRQIEGMAEALTKNPFALALLKAAGYVEASIFWQDGDMAFRCRPDFMRNDGLLVDLKTAESVEPRKFFQSARNYNYDLSVALTSQGYEALHGKQPDEYVFLCVEPEPPHLIEAYDTFVMHPDVGISYLDYGSARLGTLLEKYKECRSKNKWPGYVGKIAPMGLPGWTKYEE